MAEKEKNVTPEKKAKADRKPIFSRIGSWFKALRSEAKNVTWASGASVRKNTLIVVVCVVIISAAIGIADYLLNGSVTGLRRVLEAIVNRG